MSQGRFWIERPPGKVGRTSGRRMQFLRDPGRLGLPARVRSEPLFWTDPMEPPPSIITERGDGSKGTAALHGLSREPEEGYIRGADSTHLTQTVLHRAWCFPSAAPIPRPAAGAFARPRREQLAPRDCLRPRRPPPHFGIGFVWLITSERAIRRCGESYLMVARQAMDDSASTLFGLVHDPRAAGLVYL